MKKEKSCGTIVFFLDSFSPEYLLLHYNAGHWDFPKGHVEKGETEEATAIRELEEETGITKYRIVPGFREQIKYFFKKGKQTISKSVMLFLIESKQKKVMLSKEHKEYKWLSFNKALEQLTFKNSKELLKKAGNFLKNNNSPTGQKASHNPFKPKQPISFLV